jgi:hypothetical protein
MHASPVQTELGSLEGIGIKAKKSLGAQLVPLLRLR